MHRVIEHFREIYRYRVLIESLVWREVKARYRGSLLGYVWTLLNPLFLLFVYHLVFSRLTRAVDLPNYSVFLFVGILPWLWLSTSITTGATSIAAGGALITRVCIPPQVLPMITVLANMINFVLAIPVAMIAATAAGMVPTVAYVALPLVLALQLALVYAVVLLLAALTVPFRDVSFLVQNLMTFWFFLTPIAYPISIVPPGYTPLVLLNPATAVILPYQEILYYGRFPSATYLGAAGVWTAIVLPFSIAVFERLRNGFAEEL